MREERKKRTHRHKHTYMGHVKNPRYESVSQRQNEYTARICAREKKRTKKSQDICIEWKFHIFRLNYVFFPCRFCLSACTHLHTIRSDLNGRQIVREQKTERAEILQPDKPDSRHYNTMLWIMSTGVCTVIDTHRFLSKQKLEQY